MLLSSSCFHAFLFISFSLSLYVAASTLSSRLCSLANASRVSWRELAIKGQRPQARRTMHPRRPCPSNTLWGYCARAFSVALRCTRLFTLHLVACNRPSSLTLLNSFITQRRQFFIEILDETNPAIFNPTHSFHLLLHSFSRAIRRDQNENQWILKRKIYRCCQ